ncbi:MAG TPA: ferrochelatase [Chloroflexota bacterium]|nr:ferrochelatase [Chloroflexota bacterium]
MTGVLLMAYGTPHSLGELEDFYTHIRGGRKPAPAQITALRDRYAAIGYANEGGQRPLLDISLAQAEALDQRLGPDYRVRVGMRHWHPYIHEALADMAGEGIRQAVALSLTPQFSSLSVGAYIEAANEAAGPIELRHVRSWHLQPAYIEAMAERVRAAQDGWAPDMVVFTAHSLPRRTVEEGDPYVFQLQQTANAISGQLDLSRWILSFQSVGQGDGARLGTWLGPDILETLDRLAADGAERVLLAPIGFIADHLEILYDLDVQAKQHADSLGIELRRTQSLNADPKLIEALAAAVLQAD